MGQGKWEWIGSGVALFVVLAIGAGIYLSPYTPPKPVEIPPAGAILVKGQLVCLPHKNQNGPQTLECAFGIQDTTGRYFALRDSDPSYRNLTGIPTNVPVQVTGVFTPREDATYQSIGVIQVTNLTRTDTEQKATLSGTFVCLPHRDASMPESEECGYGLLTDAGEFYGLDFGGLPGGAPNLTVGDRIKAHGTVIPLSELPSSASWQKYLINAVFSVTDSFTFLRDTGGSSGIAGIVLLGPTCPVERTPPDPQCADKPYKTSLVLTTADQSRVITTFSSDERGFFRVPASPGTYEIRSAAAANILPYCSSRGDITVSGGTYTEATVYCDTGIR